MAGNHQQRTLDIRGIIDVGARGMSADEPLAAERRLVDASLMTAKHDAIGITYRDLREPDPRIAAIIHKALGQAQSILNIGAGTGDYEPTDRSVTAVEPSAKMIGERAPLAAGAMIIAGFVP
jgi:hypothetical protein